jgi:DNA-binding response OmpR family regulator
MNNHVLIIDDNADVLEIFNEILSEAGYKVTTLDATDNIQKTMRDHQPDLVVIDYLLNGINGGELCFQIKRSDSLKHIPVLLSSAYPRVLYSLGTYGADEVIEKPFDNDHVVARVAYHLDRARECSPPSTQVNIRTFKTNPLL